MFALLEMSKMLAEQQAGMAAISHTTPATPSGMKPIYQKPKASSRGKKKPGRKVGHPGSCREVPSRIDQRKTHRARVCPDCGDTLRKRRETRTRYTEDIPEDNTPVVTEHTRHRDWCPNCHKKSCRNLQNHALKTIPGRATVGTLSGDV